MLAKMQHDFLLPKGILAYLDKNIAEYEGIVSQYKNRYGEELIIKELNIYINIKYTGSENVTLSETKNFLYISAQLSLNEDSIIIWERIFERVISFIRDKIKKIQNEEKNEWKIIMYDYFDALFRKFFPNDVMAALPYALLLYQDEVEKDNYHAKEKINYCLKTLLLKTRSKLFDTKESTKELKQEWDAFKQEQGVEELNENLTILFKELLEKRQKTIIMGLETEERNTYITVFQNYWYKKLSEIKNAYFDEEWERFIADLNNHHDFIDKEFSYFSVHLSGLLKTREDSGLRIENWFQKFNAIPNCKPHIVDINLPDWESWIQKIRNTKNKFQDCALDSFEEIQQNYQSSVEDVLRSIFKYSLELLPENNMEFSILALGSLARKALNADSDIEFAVLLKQDDEKSVAIIQELFSVWSLCIYLLADDWILAKGETSHWRKIGLQLEAVKLEKYCKTPENYAKELEIAAEDVINNGNGESFMYFHGLCLANEIYTTSPFQNEPILGSAVEYDKAFFPLKQNTSSILFRDYQQRLNQTILTIDKESLFSAYFNFHADVFLINFRHIQLNKNKGILSLATFQSCNEKINEKQLKEIAIKPLMRFFEHVMQFETQFVTDVTYTTFTSIQIPLSIQNTLKKHLHYLNYLRCAFVYPENRIDTTEFSEAFQKVFKIARFYIFPLYMSLTKTINKNLPLSEILRNPYAAFIHMFNTDESLEITEALIESLVYILNKEEEWTNSFDTIAFHESLFKRMPTFALKKFYYESIKRIMDEDRKNSVLSHVGNIPLVTGERLSWLCDYPLWVQGLKKEMGASETEKPSYATLTLIGINEPFFLKEDIANQFWDGKKNTYQPKNEKLDGRHPVYCISLGDNKSNIYLKLYPSLPIFHDALQSLYRLSFGAQDSLPWSVVGKLTINGQIIPVLISKEEGEAIPAFNHEEKPSKKNTEDARLDDSTLDNYTFSKLLLFTMLTNPDDGKGPNFTIKDVDGKYFLFYVDYEQSLILGEAFLESNSFLSFHKFFNRKNFFAVKNILFCSNRMNESLNPTAVKEFLALDLKRLLPTWITALRELEFNYRYLFQNERETFLNYKDIKQSCLEMVLPIRILTRISYKLLALQKMLEKNNNEIPLSLLQIVEPKLHRYYSDLLTEYPEESTVYRFSVLVKKYNLYEKNKNNMLSRTSTLGSDIYRSVIQKMPNNCVSLQESYYVLNAFFKSWDATSLLNIALLQENIDNTLPSIKPNEYERLIKGLKLDILTEENRLKFLKGLANYGKIQSLYLNSPGDVLTQTLFEQIISNVPTEEGLTSITLIDAPKLSNLLVLSKANKSDKDESVSETLQKLVFEKAIALKEINFTASVSLLSLKKLVIKDAFSLQKLLVDAPKLEKLYLENCPLLTTLRFEVSFELVKNPTNKAITIKNCPRLSIKYLHRLWPELEGDNVIGNYKEMINSYVESANQGDAYAQYNLGECYYDGIGVPQNLYMAISWFKLSSQQENADALNKLGEYHESRESGEKDLQKALELYKKSADKEHADAKTNLDNLYYKLSCLYYYGKEVTEDLQKTIELLEKAVIRGHVDAQYMLGYLYYDGKGVKKDLQKTIELWEKAADKGSAIAEFNLGYLYYDGKEVKKDLQKAIELWGKAADKGHAIAEFNLGYLYYDGKEVKKDLKKAIELWEKAADKGEPDAQYRLGNCYGNGEGVEKNLKKAIELWEKAADKGHAAAQYNLGYCYCNGEGVEKNLKKAIELWEKAADKGQADAQYNLGDCYCNGEGVEKNLKKAIELWEKSADKGHADAQYRLGNCYYFAEDVEKNLKKAIFLYKKAVDKGHIGAQYRLGDCYCNGEGVEKNIKKAIELWEKAADKGQPDAQYRLGDCYCNGEGVEKNIKKAIELWEKAADKGQPDAQYRLGDCYCNGEGVEKNIKKAIELLEKAAIKGYAAAQYNLGHCYYNGEGLVEDIPKAIDLWRKANKTNEELGFNLAEYYRNSHDFCHDDELIVMLYLKSMNTSPEQSEHALQKYYSSENFIFFSLTNWIGEQANLTEKGDENAMANIAFSYLIGIGVEKNQKMAFEYYQILAEKGNPRGLYRLGIYHETNRNDSEAFKLIKMAAEKEHIFAQVWLGNYYERLIKNDESFEWYQKAATRGYDLAIYHLVRCYVFGIGTEINYTLALRYYLKALENELYHVQDDLLILLKSSWINKKEQQLNKWYQRLLRLEENGLLSACINIGFCYEYGIAVDTNKEIAIDWYTKVISSFIRGNGKEIAEKAIKRIKNQLTDNELISPLRNEIDNLPENKLISTEFWIMRNKFSDLLVSKEYGNSKYSLAYNYYHGCETKKDLQKAIKLWQKLADKGNTNAQNQLAYIYYHGEGIQKDIQKAIELWKKAARKGCPFAKHSLGFCYYDGIGVAENIPRAIELWIEVHKMDPELGYNLAEYYRDNRYSSELVLSNQFLYLDSMAISYQAEDVLEKYYSTMKFPFTNLTIHRDDSDNIATSAFCALMGGYIPPSPRLANRLYEISAEKGNARGLYRLGIYNEANGNNSEAFKLIKMAADKEHILAQIWLGNYYERLIKRNESFEWYQKAATTGYGLSIYHLARCYVFGIGTEINYQLALKLYLKAIEKEIYHAQDDLLILLKLSSISKNDQQLKEWYQRLLRLEKNGSLSACINIGFCYEHGLAVDINKEMAIDWYTRVIPYFIRGCEKEVAEKAIQRVKNQLTDNELISPLENEVARISVNKLCSTVFPMKSENDEKLLLTDPFVSIEPILQTDKWCIPDSDLEFEQHSVASDGDCWYTAFGITRENVYKLISENIYQVRDLIKVPVYEALLLDGFIAYLKENGLMDNSIIREHLEANDGKLLKKYSEDLNIIQGYISYYIRDKKIDASWPHPAILQAFAYIQQVNLYIWEPGDNHQLNPHAVYPHYVLQGEKPRIDLLFTNGNHFDRLVINNTKSIKAKTRLSGFSQTGLSLFSSASLANVNTTNEMSFVVSQTFQQKP